jgi:hypothetical protein
VEARHAIRLTGWGVGDCLAPAAFVSLPLGGISGPRSRSLFLAPTGARLAGKKITRGFPSARPDGPTR